MFNLSFADYVVGFIGCLKHVDGDWYGVPFELLDWQEAAVREFYGTVREDAVRKYQYLYLEIPKKNGKSELAAALGLYHTFADGEMYGEVYVCAADRGNAGIIFGVAAAMIEQCPALAKRAKVSVSQKVIIDTVTHTQMKVMSSEAFSKHGYKPSCVIFDELHAQPNRELWDVMTFGAGDARKQPVWIVLTTAGDDPDRNSIGWEIHEKARNILEYRNGNQAGHYDSPEWLPVIYGMPDDPDECAKIDIYDERVWYECNPSLDKTIPIEKLRQEAENAKHSEPAERLFRWLRLNQWIATKSVGWLPVTLFDRTTQKITPEQLLGKQCFGGLDLSSTTDLTAFVLLFPPQEGLETWYALFRAWITEDGMQERERRDHVPFARWVGDGFVQTTPGNVIDFDYVESEIIEASQKYELALLGTDPYLSRSITQHLAQAEINVVEIPQTMAGLSPAMKELERLIRSEQIEHEENPCARWCFGNVRCATDGNENIKPMKNKSIGRIDITVAWIIAMAASLIGQEEIDANAAILSEGWSL